MVHKVQSSDSNHRSSRTLTNNVTKLNDFLNAVINGDEDAIQQLLRDTKNSDTINNKDDRGNSCLHLALLHNHPHCFKILLRLGANVNAQDDLGNSLVHLAVLKNSVECLQALFQHLEESNNENRNQQMKDLILQLNLKGNTAILLAATCNNTKILELLLDRITDVSKTSEEPQYDGELITKLLSMQNKNGNTILHEVAKSKDTAALKFLLNHISHLNINVCNSQQMTPLHVAAIYGSQEAGRMCPCRLTSCS